MNYKATTAVIFITFTVVCGAAEEQSPPFSIDSMMVGSHGDVYLYTSIDEGETNPAGCTNPVKFVLNRNHEAYDSLYSLVLGALYSGASVKVKVTDQQCTLSAPTIVWARAYVE